MSLEPGKKVGPYEIVRLLGAGGMGQVWRARDQRLARDVAIKVLHADAELDSRRVKRFLQEARAAGTIAHPGIVTVLDVGEEDGVPFVVTELLTGQTLREKLRSGALDAKSVVRLGISIADALGAAHEHGIVHRDLKPENVMWLEDGRIKLLDFGIAKLLPPPREHALDATGAPSDPTHQTATMRTETGTILGTAGYMSPEQVAAQDVDARADLFSLGAILHEALGGGPAFLGKHAVERMAAVLKEPPAPLLAPASDEPAGLRAVIARCLEKNREDRYATASDVSVALSSLEAPSMVVEKPPSAPRRALLLASVGLGAGTLAGAIGFAVGRGTAITVPSQRPVVQTTNLPIATSSAPTPPAQPSRTRYQKASFKPGTIINARFLPEAKSFVYGALFNGGELALYMGRLDAVGDQSVDVPPADILAVSRGGELALCLHRKMSLWALTGTLARVSLAGGTPREVAHDVYSADYLPGGKELLLSRRVAGQCRLELGLDTVLFESGGWLSDVRISPDGKLAAFSHHPLYYADDGDVMIVSLDGKSPARALTSGWISLQGLAWTADGQALLFTAVPGTPGAHVDRALHQVSLTGDVRLLLQGAGRLKLHDVAADGSLLLTQEDESAVTMARAKGAESEINLSSLDFTMLVTISSDGKTAVLSEQSSADQVTYDVQLRDLDGSPAKRLGEGVGWHLSPDGQWVASAPIGENADLVLLPAGAGQSRILSQKGFAYLQAHWFPDGQRLLVLAAEGSKRPRFWVQSLADGAMQPVGREGDWFDSFVAFNGESVVLIDNLGVLSVVPLTGGAAPIEIELPPLTCIGGGNEQGEVLLFRRGERPGMVERIDPRTKKRRPFVRVGPHDRTGVVEITRFWASSDEQSYAYTYLRLFSTLYLVNGVL